jgi:hypothetical protein
MALTNIAAMDGGDDMREFIISRRGWHTVRMLLTCDNERIQRASMEVRTVRLQLFAFNCLPSTNAHGAYGLGSLQSRNVRGDVRTVR